MNCGQRDWLKGGVAFFAAQGLDARVNETAKPLNVFDLQGVKFTEIDADISDFGRVIEAGPFFFQKTYRQKNNCMLNLG